MVKATEQLKGEWLKPQSRYKESCKSHRAGKRRVDEATKQM